MDFPTGNLTFEVPSMNPKERLRELILYIAEVSRSDSRFGKTKLVKLLYVCDFESFRETGKPITGHKYVKLPNGPYPDNLNVLLREMVKARDITIEEDPYYGYPYPQHRVVAQRHPNLESFSTQEIADVDGFIRRFWEYSGTDMANLTHGIAWEVANMTEAIPYEASIISDEDLTQEDLDHINHLVQRYGIDPK